MAMEVEAFHFFVFLAYVCVILTRLGFHALGKTELPNSVSPQDMIIFRRLVLDIVWLSILVRLVRVLQDSRQRLPPRRFGISRSSKPKISPLQILLTCFDIIFQSSFSWIIRIPYAPYLIPYLYVGIKVICLFHLLPILETFTIRYPVNLILCSAPALIFPQNYFILPVVNLLVIGKEFYANPPRDTRLAFQTAVVTSLFLHCVRDERFFVFVPAVFMTYTVFLLIVVRERGQSIESALGALVTKVKVKEKKMANFIEFAVRTVGALLFQNFFRLKSFSQVLAFICFAGAWLAYLTLLRISYDFGVLNFLLRNVAVGCTVSQYGLRAITWLAYGVSLLLYGLRLVLVSWTLVQRPNQPPQIVLW